MGSGSKRSWNPLVWPNKTEFGFYGCGSIHMPWQWSTDNCYRGCSFPVRGWWFPRWKYRSAHLFKGIPTDVGVAIALSCLDRGTYVTPCSGVGNGAKDPTWRYSRKGCFLESKMLQLRSSNPTSDLPGGACELVWIGEEIHDLTKSRAIFGYDNHPTNLGIPKFIATNIQKLDTACPNVHHYEWSTPQM